MAEKLIDIENVIKKKNPRLVKALPRFILKYLKKKLHEEDINSFISEHGNKLNFDFAEAILTEFGVHINVVGTENIPMKGGFFIAANHPLGGLDGIAMIHAVGKVRRDIKLLVNDILLNLNNLKQLFVPVNKVGRNSPEITEQIDKAYASDEALIVFPAGLVSRKQSSGVMDLEWKKSFISRSRRHRKPIIPVFIEGKNSGFFYNFARLRKKIGIKANIEMFFLVDEMYKQKNKTITLIFGEPVPFETFTKDYNDAFWAEQMKRHVYEIGKAGKPVPFVLKKN
jgi:putative hemolysin